MLCLSHSHLEEFPRTKLSCVKIYYNDIPNDSITIKLTTTLRFIDIAFKLATVISSNPDVFEVMSRLMIRKTSQKSKVRTRLSLRLPRSCKEVPKETVQDQTTAHHHHHLEHQLLMLRRRRLILRN